MAAITLSAGTFLFMTQTESLSAPTSSTPAPYTTVPSLQAMAQLAMLPTSQAALALAQTSFSSAQKASILAALQKGEMRLVEMPLLDSSGISGQIVDVTTSGMTQRVVLTGRFQRVVLPISIAGEVVVSPVTTPHAPALTISAMTALGPEILPSLTALNQRIVLSIIVQ